jgi:transcriptional regulator with XRE-family HTH domain
MTPATRLRAALRALHWTQRGLAAILGQDERRVRRWLAGTYETPGDVLEWLEMLAQVHAANPPPRREFGAEGGKAKEETP